MTQNGLDSQMFQLGLHLEVVQYILSLTNLWELWHSLHFYQHDLYLSLFHPRSKKMEKCVKYQLPNSREQEHVLISDTPMLLIEINSISNMGRQK